MVARINTRKDMLGILNYNENKVKAGLASCIGENGFICPVDKLTFKDKMNGFSDYTNQNKRSTSKAVHVSLNFHPDEKLSTETLMDIASEYMKLIGFESQPYLVYQHFDAAHPHLHIITTKIKKDGKRIDLYNIGRNQSENARKKIEASFGLRRTGKESDKKYTASPIDVKKALYGKQETKRSIANAVSMVVKNYRFTSLHEFNAVLGQFNVRADRGSETSRVYLNRGLHYRLLDGNGKLIGVPIKASSLPAKPTLKNLERQYKVGEVLRKPHKDRIVSVIETAFDGRRLKASAFTEALKKENISVVFRGNDEGRIYGVTFIDHQTKVVFNGSDLGKAYGAKGIIERFTGPQNNEGDTSLTYRQKKDPDSFLLQSDVGKALDDLIEARQFDYMSPDAAMKRKKKKKRGRSI